ncbi:hypothetical protein J7J63_05885 [Candidatus Bipolaricaulota bacterium]|nr:hypothetical protein [Candidatus Bipolaricaulota bacterium]
MINSQGTTIYVGQIPATEWGSCGEAITALKGSPIVECPQSVGDIGETRGSTEYKCLSSNDTAKSLGAVSRQPFDVEVLMNPSDMTGQRDLRKAFRNNTPIRIGIAYGETMLYFNAKVSGITASIAQDAAIATTFTIEIAGDIHECSTANLIARAVINNGIIIVNNGIPVLNTH